MADPKDTPQGQGPVILPPVPFPPPGQPVPIPIPGPPRPGPRPQPPRPPAQPRPPKPEPKPPETPKPPKPAVPPKPPKPTVEPKLIITRTTYPRHWNDLATAPIALGAAGTKVIAAARTGFKLFIATIVLTVSDITTITIDFGIYGQSGAMNFGDTGQPMGIVIAMGDSPAPCGAGGFSITSSGATASVGGFITYYTLKDQR